MTLSITFLRRPTTGSCAWLLYSSVLFGPSFNRIDDIDRRPNRDGPWVNGPRFPGVFHGSRLAGGVRLAASGQRLRVNVLNGQHRANDDAGRRAIQFRLFTGGHDSPPSRISP